MREQGLLKVTDEEHFFDFLQPYRVFWQENISNNESSLRTLCSIFHLVQGFLIIP